MSVLFYNVAALFLKRFMFKVVIHVITNLEQKQKSA